LGSVFTNTRKGTSARDRIGDHATATPRNTPTAPASPNAPTISTDVIERCRSHGISSPVMACTTRSGAGSRYSRSWNTVTASCQATSRATKSAAAGR